MTTRDTAFVAGTPCWIDLFSADPAKAKEFYGAVFGWTAQDSGEEFGGYVTFFSDGQQVAGMMQNPEESGTPDLWSTYISSDDIDATVAAATAAGAQVVAPAMAVSDLGSMAVLIDPAGGAFGIWQPGKHTGFNKYNEPNSVTWDEYTAKTSPLRRISTPRCSTGPTTRPPTPTSSATTTRRSTVKPSPA